MDAEVMIVLAIENGGRLEGLHHVGVIGFLALDDTAARDMGMDRNCMLVQPEVFAGCADDACSFGPR